jgi:hypothetical protein
MTYIKSLIVLFFLSVISLSCIPEDVQFTVDYSQKIIDEWKQVSRFGVVEDGTFPSTFDWFDVEDGFILKLFENDTFNYTKYENCCFGTYSFGLSLNKIFFIFGYQIDYNREQVTELTESFGSDIPQYDLLLLFHFYGVDQCNEECNSLLKRID